MSALPDLTVRTDRMVLRRLQPDDIGEFVRVHETSLAAWKPWTPARPDVGLQALFRQEIDRTEKGAAAGTHLRLWAFDHDRMVGMFSLNEIARGVFQSAFAGWQISADRMGQGLGTEGVRALLDIAFARAPHGIDLHRVQANIMPHNAASLRIAEKVGLRREGVASRYLRIAGRWEDHVMFAVTREELEG